MRTIDRRIEVKVSGAYLDKDNRNAGVQYEANVTDLRITFDEGWDGYAKTVTFWNAMMSNPVKRTLTTDLLEADSTRVYIVPIPGEALTEAGDMTFVIDGYSVEPLGEDTEYVTLAEDITEPTDAIKVYDAPSPISRLLRRKISIGGNVYTIVSLSTHSSWDYSLLYLSGEVSSGAEDDKIYPADGKRKRSASATLWVNEAPYAEDAAEPSDPTPTQAEQLQVQVDSIINTIAEAKTARDEAKAAAQQTSKDAATASGALELIQGYDSTAAEQAALALQHATAAGNTYNSISKTLMPQINTWHSETKTNAQNAADAEGRITTLEGKASAAASNASRDAASVASAKNEVSNVLTAANHTKTELESIRTEVMGYKAAAESAKSAASGSESNAATYAKRAETAETNAETAQAKAEAAQTAAEAAAGRAEKIAIGGLASESYVNEKAAERVLKTGDAMTGTLGFNTPTLFSAFYKDRTINGVTYRMRVGVGNDGEGGSGTFSLRLFTLDASGIETRVGQLDFDKTGITWISPGGVKKTVAHSGNIGVLTATLEG